MICSRVTGDPLGPGNQVLTVLHITITCSSTFGSDVGFTFSSLDRLFALSFTVLWLLLLQIDLRTSQEVKIYLIELHLLRIGELNELRVCGLGVRRAGIKYVRCIVLQEGGCVNKYHIRPKK